MSSVSRGAVMPLVSLALLAGTLALSEMRPGLAQTMLDFGQSGGEDILDGGPASFGPAPSVSSSPVRRGVQPAPRPHRDMYREPSFRTLPRATNRYEHSGRSLTYVRPSYYRGTGVFANANPTGGSILAFVPPEPAAHGFEPAGPKLIDVNAERLDRRPIGSAGIAYHYAGTAKIIRIAPNHRQRSGKPEDAALPPQDERPIQTREMVEHERTGEAVASASTSPAPAPSERERDASAGTFLEPWSDDWLRHCEERHADFDAALGTYTDEAGRRRFCTGDPA